MFISKETQEQKKIIVKLKIQFFTYVFFCGEY